MQPRVAQLKAQACQQAAAQLKTRQNPLASHSQRRKALVLVVTTQTPCLLCHLSCSSPHQKLGLDIHCGTHKMMCSRTPQGQHSWVISGSGSWSQRCRGPSGAHIICPCSGKTWMNARCAVKGDNFSAMVLIHESSMKTVTSPLWKPRGGLALCSPYVQPLRTLWSCTFCRMKRSSGSQQCHHVSKILERQMQPQDQLVLQFAREAGEQERRTAWQQWSRAAGLSLHTLERDYLAQTPPYHSQAMGYWASCCPSCICDYGEPFQEAMWLDLVKERLNTEVYTVAWFVQDMRLIFRNHKTFHKCHCPPKCNLSVSAVGFRHWALPSVDTLCHFPFYATDPDPD
ncbi:hypothetical protein H8959_004537 [Pygathrix nigripes]